MVTAKNRALDQLRRFKLLQRKLARIAIAHQPIEHRIAREDFREKTRDTRHIVRRGAPHRRCTVGVHRRSDSAIATRQENRMAPDSSA